MSRRSMRIASFLLAVFASFSFAGGDLVSDVRFGEGPTAFRPPVVCVPTITEAPTIDGKLDDAAWRDAAHIDHLLQMFYPEDRRMPSPATRVKLMRDAAHLYVAFICDEPNLPGIIDKSGGVRDKWANDVVEIFFDVRPQGPDAWHLATNSCGWQYDSKVTKFRLPKGGSEATEHDPKWRSVAHIGDNQWTVEIAIHWRQLNVNLAAWEGKALPFNLARERYNNDGKHELSVWSPTGGPFSKTERYGYMFFGDEAAWDKVRTDYVPAEQLAITPYMDRRTYRDDMPIAGGGLNVGEEMLDDLGLHLSIRQGDTVLREQVIDKIADNRAYFDINLAGLAPGDYRFVADVLQDAVPRGSGEHTFRIIAAPKVAQQGRIALTQSQPVGRTIDKWHVRTGVPIPQSVMGDANQVGVFDSSGNQIPAQVQPIAHWSKGGKVKWLSVDFNTELTADETERYELRFAPDIKPLVPVGITVKETTDDITIDTGVARFTIRRKGFNLFDQLWVGGEQRLTSADNRGLYTVSEAGDVHWASLDPNSQVIIEEAGPRAVVVKASGAHVNAAGEALCRYVVHLYFYADSPYVRVQHTFIISEDSKQTRYSDIGMTLPIAGDRVTFGLPAEHATGQLETAVGASVSLLQRTWNEFVVKDNAASQNILTSDRAPGWIARGDVAIIVRDFWQNFPKELQATPADLRVHFWPGHGETAFSQAQEIDPTNAWRLPFVHQGKLLDFNVPDYYFGNEALTAVRFDRNNSARACNAIGVGKTHDMLLAFGDVEQTAALNEAFQAGVHFMPDPKWVCESLVAGELHPYDPQQFTEQEDYFSRGHDFLMRAMFDANEAYGMFNYGDGFTMLDTASPTLQQSYYRLWAGYHHGRARVPWLLYLRSGDPKYLKWAKANTGHIGDVDTCHYSNEHFENKSGLAQKRVGGLCSYNAVVHWENGALFNYNSMADIFMYDYYLTGNRRSWDVLEEVVQLARIEGDKRCPPNRAGAGILATMLQCYEATWDPQLIVMFLAGIPNMYEKPAWTHQPRSVTWAPYLEPYIRFSDDPAAKQFLLQHADYLATLDATGTRIQYHHRELAEASKLTGDERYRLAAWSQWVRGPGLFDQQGSNFNGEVYWLDYSFLTQHALYLMKPMAGALPGLSGLVSVPGSGGPSTWVHSLRDASEKQTVTITVEDHDDKPFTFGTRFACYSNVDYTLTDPNGKSVATGVITPPAHDQYIFELAQPSDGVRGTYRLVLSSPRRFSFWYASVSDLGTHRFHLPNADAPRGRLDEPAGLGSFGTGRWYFYVPADCEMFRIRIMGWPDARARTVAAAIDPDNRAARRISLMPREQGDLIVEPKRAHRGKVWALSFDQAVIVDVEGIDRWFAGTMDGAKPTR